MTIIIRTAGLLCGICVVALLMGKDRVGYGLGFAINLALIILLLAAQP